MNILYDYVLQNKLVEFNQEASRVHGKSWKTAKTVDDLAKMKEHDFLNRLENISVIGKSVKEALQECLKRRNGCGHPNSMKVGTHNVAHHIEVLLLNVYERFSN